MAVITVSNTGGNWNATGTWVGSVVPLTTDTVAFTATSGQLTVNVASTCAGIDFTNYLNTITFNADLIVNGPLNLGTGGYTQAGSFGISINASSTITPGGVTWTRTLTFNSGSATMTIGSLLTASSITIAASSNITFAGAGSFTTSTLTFLTGSSSTCTFASGKTYTVTSAITANQTTPSTPMSINSSTASSSFNLAVSASATCNMGYTNLTDVNATGRTINIFGDTQTLTRCTNCQSFTQPKVVGG